MRRVGSFLLGALGCAACGGPAPAGRVSGTIAVLANGQVAVVNPDQGSVSLVDGSTLSTLTTVPVGADPKALLEARSGALWVAVRRAGTLVRVDPSTLATTTVPVCDGPTALAESPDGAWLAVSCEWSGEIERVNPTTGQATLLAGGLQRPQGLVIVGSSVVVAEQVGGTVAVISGRVQRVSLVPSAAPYRPALTRMTASVASAVVPAFGHLFVPHQLVNHTGDTADEAVADDYGTVLNGTPKVNAALTRLSLAGEAVSAPADTPAVYARFDTPTHVGSGPVAAAPFGNRFLLVAQASTNDVAVLDTTATDPNARLVGTFQVGGGPSGVAVNAAQSAAYVDNAFDNAISRIDLTLALGASAPQHPAALTRVRGLASPFSAAALAGRKLFYDATNPHVTPSRVVACASCHPAGMDDGLVWFIHTPNIPLKRRRTPNLANATTGTAPYHWDGAFAAMSDLVSGTVTNLMAGDGLLVDPTTVQAYVDEIVQAPVAPLEDPAAVSRGQALFAASCQSCHTPPSFTDGLEHAVLNPMSLSSDDVLTAANTPALHALFFRTGFFHDGRSPTLTDLLTRADAKGHSGDLSSAQVSDLVAYLNHL